MIRCRFSTLRPMTLRPKNRCIPGGDQRAWPVSMTYLAKSPMTVSETV